MTRPTVRPMPRATESVESRTSGRRRLVTLLVGLLTIGAIATGVALWRGRDQAAEDQAGTVTGKPVVGGDLHATASRGKRLFVSGHEGAAYSDDSSTWTAIRGLDGKDAMGWATLADRIFVGGHEGLYVSSDGGATFSPAQADLPVTDVHAVGGTGRTVYLASPQGGLFVSTDAGRTFAPRSAVGQSFMGSILVDPTKPDHAYAPDMMAGVAETVDGGRTWQSLGGPSGAMSVGWNPADQARMVAVGAQGVMLSADSGRSWRQINAPAGTAAATFDNQGRLVAAILVGDRARVETSKDSGTSWQVG